MSTHTPGPWHIEFPPQPAAAGDGFRITARGDTTNWRGYVTNVMAHSPNADANARLIAAAPDMLEALKRVEMFFTANVSTYVNHDELPLVRAAIAKATGEA